MKTDRRNFLKLSAGAVAAAALLRAPLLSAAEAPAAAAQAGGGNAAPLALSPGEQLFLDDHLIGRQTNLTREIESPQRLPEPIITSAEDKCFQPYTTVIRDPQRGRFRHWYNTTVSSSQSHIGYLESEDGIHVIRPHRELADPSGLRVGFGASVIEEGGPPGSSSDPSRRFKLAWYDDGLYIAFSPDGLDWKAASDKPVLHDIGDITALSWDPIRKRYLLTCKVGSRPEDGYKGSTPNAREGTRRLVGQSVSHDCIHWSPPKRIIVADDQDEGVTEFYSVGNVIARGGLLIGMLKVLRDDLAAEPGGEKHGIGYTCLAWTRDGETWQRDRKPFMDRNPTPHTWDRAMTWGDCLLPVDDEVFAYYGGYARGHKVERFKERQIGFARMKRDRFVSRRAGGEEGTLRTPVLTLDGSGLTVNADVAGELRARVCDASGRAIEGFDAGDCAPVKGDSLAHALKWKQPLASLRGKPVQLEFVAREARLFGFDLMA
jgi:hypothetical protein